MRYLGTYPAFGLRFLHAFDQHPLPEFSSLSHVCEMRCDHTRILADHAHPGVEICYVASGRLQRTSHRQRTVVLPGECSITPPQERHGSVSSPGHPCHYFSVAFDPAQLSLEGLEPHRGDHLPDRTRAGAPCPPSVLNLALAQRVVAVGPEVERLFRRMLTELENLVHSDSFGRRLGALMIRTQLMELLIQVLQARHHQGDPMGRATTSMGKPPPRRAFQDLLDWLPSRLADPPKLAEMARRVQLSPAHFCGAFTREVGETPLSYLGRLRLEAAAHALGRGQAVTEVSRSLGFRSTQYFSERFRLRYGMTPTQWRVSQAHGSQHDNLARRPTGRPLQHRQGP